MNLWVGFSRDRGWFPTILIWTATTQPKVSQFEVNNGNTRMACNVSFLPFSSIFHTLLRYFHCWLWASKCRLGEQNYRYHPANIYLFKVTIETLEKRMKYCKLWTYFTTFSCVSIVDFEHVNVSWVKTWLISIVSNQIIVNDYITQNRFKFCTFQYILLTDHTVHNVYSEIFVSEWMFVSQSCVVGFNPFSGWCSIFILSENTRKQLFSGG